MFERIKEDIAAIKSRDPAARSSFEVVTCYPSFHVGLFYRGAHWLWKREFRTAGRWLSQLGRWFTGIEIHPGATIGRRFFIDHGMGVVIGEYAEIGDDVTLYHGVTLGGTAPSIDSDSQRNKKRHPTLGNGVIVGSGAQILGPVEVGENARVGANAVVTKAVSANTTVVGIPAKEVMRTAPHKSEFVAYGTPCDQEIVDPLIKVTESLFEQVTDLNNKVACLQKELEASGLDPDALKQRFETASEKCN
ncbi:MAG: serine O-acetyltransferase EpsC [Alphaproteobacteria bacterium]